MWVERQIPDRGEVFIDHVGYFVADLDAAGAQLERLGFKVSLTNVQTNQDASGALKPSGTSNRLAKLKFGFFEILAATHDTPLAAQFKNQIARYSGLHLIAFSGFDMPMERTRLIAAGFDMQPVVELKRHDRTMADNPEVHFSVLRPQPGVMAEGRLQWVRPHTVDSVWRAGTITTENGAEGLTDMLICVADPAAVAERYGRYLAHTPVKRGATHVVPTKRGDLVFADAAGCAALVPGFAAPSVPYMSGQAVRADIAKARAWLEKAGITALIDKPDAILLGPADALGSYLLFHAPGVEQPWSTLA